MTGSLAEIRQKIADDRFEFSKHALDQSISLNFTQYSGSRSQGSDLNGQIIEDYPDDKYGASCLISGSTQDERPIHIHCSCPSRPLVKIITLYEPIPQRWNDDFTQRTSN
jgi:Domain of unknown function (DUF4258)